VVPEPAVPEAREALPTLEAVVRRHLEAALRACAGRIEGTQGAARVLGLNAATLRSKLRKLGIVADDFR
jgi:transcriptional regulator with GAF, ATPase, and Fis domain